MTKGGKGQSNVELLLNSPDARHGRLLLLPGSFALALDRGSSPFSLKAGFMFMIMNKWVDKFFQLGLVVSSKYIKHSKEWCNLFYHEKGLWWNKFNRFTQSFKIKFPVKLHITVQHGQYILKMIFIQQYWPLGLNVPFESSFAFVWTQFWCILQSVTTSYTRMVIMDDTHCLFVGKAITCNDHPGDP